MNIKIKEEFKEILESEGCLEDFTSNIKKYCKKNRFSVKKTIADLNNMEKFTDMVMRAFYWEDTPQGFDFWSDLQDKYYHKSRITISS